MIGIDIKYGMPRRFPGSPGDRQLYVRRSQLRVCLNYQVVHRYCTLILYAKDQRVIGGICGGEIDYDMMNNIRFVGKCDELRSYDSGTAKTSVKTGVL
jgi:hypothetical protein